MPGVLSAHIISLLTIFVLFCRTIVILSVIKIVKLFDVIPICEWFLVKKKEYIGIRPNVYHATNIINLACLVCSINCGMLQRNIWPRSFCTNLALRARSVQKRPIKNNISLILLIHNMLYIMHVYIIICIVRIEKTSKKQYFSVQTSRSVNKKLLIHSYIYMCANLYFVPKERHSERSHKILNTSNISIPTCLISFVHSDNETTNIGSEDEKQ